MKGGGPRYEKSVREEGACVVVVEGVDTRCGGASSEPHSQRTRLMAYVKSRACATTATMPVQTRTPAPPARHDMSVILVTGSYDHDIRFWEAWSGICSRTIARTGESGVRNESHFSTV